MAKKTTIIEDVSSENNIEMVAKAIKEKYGDICIPASQLADNHGVFIPTGLTGLDIALNGGIREGTWWHIGGVPKCVGRDTLVPTNKGLLYIYELTNDCLVKTIDGYRKPLDFIKTKSKNNYRITLENGFSVICTHDHRWATPSETMGFGFVTAENLKIGDSLRFNISELENAAPEGDLELAIILGLLISEGHLPRKIKGNKSRIMSFTNKDQRLLKIFRDWCDSKNFTFKSRERNIGNWCDNLHVEGQKYLEQYIDRAKSGNKRIPEYIRKSGPETQKAFLRALFEGDGCVYRRKSLTVEYDSKSKRLIEELAQMLLTYGIYGTIGARSIGGDQYYRLTIVSNFAVDFMNKIGFLYKDNPNKMVVRGAYRQFKYGNIFTSRIKKEVSIANGGKVMPSTLYQKGPRVHAYGGLSKACKIAENIGVDVSDIHDYIDSNIEIKISSIKKINKEIDVYCLEMPNDHFIANGLVSGNCGKSSLILTMAAQAGRILGKNTYYFDIENRLQDELVHCIEGLDRSKLMVIKAKGRLLNAEEWLSMVETTLKDDPGCICVIDSVAMLATEAEMASEMTDMSRASIPKLMYKLARRISPVLPSTKSTLITITHLQANPTGYGSPFREVGGNAANYAASYWMTCISATKVEKDGKMIGKDSKFKILATATGAPDAEPIIPIRFGRGCDKYVDLAIIAEDVGLIVKGGSWYEFKIEEAKKDGKNLKVQGIDGVCNILQADPALFAVLDSKIREIAFGKKKDEK